MTFEFRDVSSEVSRTHPTGAPFSGGLWVSNSGDVVGQHNFSTDGSSTNPDIAGSPLESFALETGGNGHVAAQWGFTVTGSSGDDWDDILASPANVVFDLSWDGALLGDDGSLFDVGEIFFSHVFGDGSAALASLGSWVENNNSAATPGTTVDPVWTYLELGSLDPLTGATGIFGMVAVDPDDVMGVRAALTAADTDAAFIATAGSGQLSATAVPAPASLLLLGSGILGLAALVRRRRGDG